MWFLKTSHGFDVHMASSYEIIMFYSSTGWAHELTSTHSILWQRSEKEHTSADDSSLT